MSGFGRSNDRVNRYRCGIAAYLDGQFEDAIQFLTPLAGEADPMTRTARRYVALAHRHLGMAALNTGDFSAAESHLRSAIRHDGPKGELSRHLAALYAKTGRYGYCAREMERAAEADGSAAATWRQLAQAQWRAGHRTQAYMTLATATRNLGPLPDFDMQLGLFYAAEDRFADAHTCFARAAETDSANPQAHYLLGLAAAQQGDVGAAVKSLQRAVELRPGDLLTAYQLAMAARAARAAGIETIVRVSDLSAPTTGSQVRQLANYITAEPEFIEAVLTPKGGKDDPQLLELLLGVVRLALEEHPRYADLHYHAAELCSRLGRIDEAVTHAQAAVAVNPHFARAMVLLGKLYAQTQQGAQAVECLRSAIADGADYPDVHCLAGELLIHSDAHDEAKHHLARALQLKSNYPRAAEAMKKLAA